MSTPQESPKSLETCESVQIWFQPDTDGTICSLIVWRGKPTLLEELPEGKRVRDLQSGDVVTVSGGRRVVDYVEPYR